MIRNLKALGLGLVAAIAMGAVAASAAHATEARIKCGNDTTQECTIKVTHHPGPGIPLGKLKTNAGNVECEETHGISTVKDGEKLSAVTLTELNVSECELGGIFAAVSIPAACHLTEKAGETVAGGATGKVDLAATTGGCEIKITAGSCVIAIKAPQENLSSITQTNVKTGTKEEITAHAEVKGIKYGTTASCPGGAGEFANGEFIETITAQGFKKSEESVQTDLTVEDA